MNLVRLPYSMAMKKAPAKGKKRSATKKQHTPDYYPIQRTTSLAVGAGSFNGTLTGDCGKMLSIINRRLYRYGKMYTMKIDLDVDITVGTDIEVEVYALSNTWDNQRAYALAKKTYDEALADERAVLPGNQSRWEDFRIEHGLNSAVTLQPATFDRDTLALTVRQEGEFTDSIVDENGVAHSFTWGAPVGNQLGVITEWDKAGNVSADPESISTVAPYAGVNNDGLSTIEATALGQRGNLPPYDQSTTADSFVRVGTLYYRPGPTGLSRLSTGFFEAPCGLFALKTNTALGNGTVRLTVKGGDYKGVMALDMAQE